MREYNVCKNRGFLANTRHRNVAIVAALFVLVVLPLIVMAATGVFADEGDSAAVASTSGDVGGGVPAGDPGVDSSDDNTTSSSPPTASPAVDSDPTSAPTKPISYRPGQLTKQENGMLLSTGLQSRLLAQSNYTVALHNGKNSTDVFHFRPDGAAVFAVPDELGENQGGWVYVSNSEILEKPEPGLGGVGAVTFDKDGNVIGYKRLLGNTTMNCSGGKTPWGTWVSCEEVAYIGQVYQVDPFGRRPAELLTVGKMQGGRYEAFAYDDRNKKKPYFYFTEDQANGPLRRWTPDSNIIDWNDDPWNMLHGNGTLDYMLLFPHDDNKDTGTYNFTDSVHRGRQNAEVTYPSSEGIDRKDNLLYITCKKEKYLYIIDLDSNRYVRHSMEHGLFEGEPDQITRILNDTKDILYFNEDLGNVSGIHARNNQGQFFTIMEGTNWTNEATGLSFSPSGYHMYVCFQDAGVLFEITREDGHPFQAETLDVRYHNQAVDSLWSRYRRRHR